VTELKEERTRAREPSASKFDEGKEHLKPSEYADSDLRQEEERVRFQGTIQRGKDPPVEKEQKGARKGKIQKEVAVRGEKQPIIFKNKDTALGGEMEGCTKFKPRSKGGEELPTKHQ